MELDLIAEDLTNKAIAQILYKLNNFFFVTSGFFRMWECGEALHSYGRKQELDNKLNFTSKRKKKQRWRSTMINCSASTIANQQASIYYQK